MATTFLKKIATVLEAANSRSSSSSGLRLLWGISSLWKKSPTRSVVEKPVLIVARNHNRRDIATYVVTVPSSGGNGQGSGGNEDVVDRAPKLIPIWKSRSLDRNSFALIGSSLYSLGGGKKINRPSSLAYVTDLGLGLGCPCPNPPPPKKRWNCIRGMHNERLDAREVVIDGKLYVFGGIYIPQSGDCDSDDDTDFPLPSPWAEVYDPKQQLWKALTDPPLYLAYIDLFVAYDHSSSSKEKENKRVVVGGRSPLLGSIPVLLAYDVVDDTWETISVNIPWFFPSTTRPVLYDNQLYWIADRVVVYDLHLKQMFFGPIKGYFDPNLLQNPFDMDYNPIFFHIVGDEFGVIWLSPDECRKSFRDRKICCTTMRISTTIDENGSIGSVTGHSLFTRCYPVDQHIYSLDGLLLTHGILWEK